MERFAAFLGWLEIRLLNFSVKVILNFTYWRIKYIKKPEFATLLLGYKKRDDLAVKILVYRSHYFVP